MQDWCRKIHNIHTINNNNTIKLHNISEISWYIYFIFNIYFSNCRHTVDRYTLTVAFLLYKSELAGGSVRGEPDGVKIQCLWSKKSHTFFHKLPQFFTFKNHHHVNMCSEVKGHTVIRTHSCLWRSASYRPWHSPSGPPPLSSYRQINKTYTYRMTTKFVFLRVSA